MTALLLQGAVLGLSAAMLPGPFQAFLLAESSRRGWRRTLPVAFAPLLSDGPVLLLVFVVVGRFPPDLLEVLRVAGGAFVAYLAYGALRAVLTGAVADGSAYGGVVKGAVTNLLNPNPWLFWGLVGAPIVLEAWRAGPPRAVGFLVAFYVVMVSASGALIVLFGSAARLGRGLRRVLMAVSAATLVGFAAYEIAVGLERLLR